MNQNNTTIDLQAFFPANLKIEKISTTSDTIYIQMKSLVQSLICPNCEKELQKHHATHTRKVQDLPILGKQTILLITLHEFHCDNPNCSRISITENLSGFLTEYHRMTERLEDLVVQLALETSCEGAARILRMMHIKISGDTVIRTLLRRFEQQPVLTCGNCIGVDDFSFKKRHTYGTIIVDEETHQPIAILDGRDGSELKEWLTQNKHVTTITRDRASAYAKAVEEILPNAMQIADRFHLHQNLLDAIKKILGKEIPVTTVIPKTEKVSQQNFIQTEEKADKKKTVLSGII